MPRWRWILLQITRRLWVRATLIGMLGILSAGLAALGEYVVFWEPPENAGIESVDVILKIIASSMLSVTTFSLSIMTAAYASATNNVTPRAIKLLLEDNVTQNALSTFLGSFLFSIVGIVVLQIGAYGERGRFMVFAMTIVVIALIVVALLRWIDHLTRLGRVGETTKRVEEAVWGALKNRLKAPHLGGVSWSKDEEISKDAIRVNADAVGYIQHIDVENLDKCCEELHADVYLMVQPGDFLYPCQPVAWIVPSDGFDDESEASLRERISYAVTLDEARTFDQDPRFGFVVLSEIAIRAMSPGVNDPGTAIDVIGRITRLLAQWAEHGADLDGNGEAIEPKNKPFKRVHAPALTCDDLFEDAFMLIARDGAALVEVQIHLRWSLLSLEKMGGDDFKAAARRQLDLACERAEKALVLEKDKERLHAIDEEFA